MNFGKGPQNSAVRAVYHKNMSSGKTGEKSATIVVETQSRYGALMSGFLVAPAQSLGGIEPEDEAVTRTDDQHVSSCCHCARQTRVHSFLNRKKSCNSEKKLTIR